MFLIRPDAALHVTKILLSGFLCG
ncbi:uncharacterized protein METZ01_LOCUS399221, partial [marine metagenome]